nr:hypothetical protein [Tanacetum cinerariifolium]
MVKRLEKKKRSRTYGLKRLYKVGLSTRVESFGGEQILGEEDESKQGRNIVDIDVDAKINLVDEIEEDLGRINDEKMFDTDVLNDEEVVVKDINAARIVTAITAALITTADVTPDKLTMAQALVEINKSKPKGATATITIVTIRTPNSTRHKARGVVMQEPIKTPTTATI